MNFVRGAKIGHGSFGIVNLAIPTNQNSNLMAVKSCGVAHSAELMNEKLVLDELKDCPEIISCFGDCYSFERGENLYNVLLEYASGGNLAEKITSSNDNQLQEFEVRRYTNSILRGLQFIHKNGYVHCDIKLQNILISQNGDVKIADFGLAKRENLKEIRGSPINMSPEMVTGGEQRSPADIWAVGCVVLEMLTGAPAWRCSDMEALLMKIGVGEEVPEVSSNLSDEAKDFLEKCFVRDPTKRWTAEMLLDHSFVSNLDDIRDVSYSTWDGFSNIVSEKVDYRPSISPRCPFDFEDWVSESNSLTPSKVSELDFDFVTSISLGRLKRLECNGMPEWSVEDDWISVR